MRSYNLTFVATYLLRYTKRKRHFLRSVLRGDVTAVRFMLTSNYADLECLKKNYTMMQMDGDGSWHYISPLHVIMLDHPNMVRELVRHGFEIEVYDLCSPHAVFTTENVRLFRECKIDLSKPCRQCCKTLLDMRVDSLDHHTAKILACEGVSFTGCDKTWVELKLARRQAFQLEDVRLGMQEVRDEIARHVQLRIVRQVIPILFHNPDSPFHLLDANGTWAHLTSFLVPSMKRYDRVTMLLESGLWRRPQRRQSTRRRKRIQ